MNKPEAFAKYQSIVDDIKECMLVTDDPEVGPRARPMYLAGQDDDGKLWFFTEIDTDKVDEIYKDRFVCCAFSQPSDKAYASATGRATIERSLALKKKYYSKMQDAWFDGPEDPKASLICVHVQHAEYWKDSDSSLVAFAKIAAASVTGDYYDNTENEKVAV